MFKHRKVFKGYGERETPKWDADYRTKKSKLLEYILPTIFIVFFLLLILLNVEFNNKIHQIAQTNALLHGDEKNSIENLSFKMAPAVELNKTIRHKRDTIQSLFSAGSGDHLNNPPNIFKEFEDNFQNYTQLQECVSNSKTCSYSCTYGKYYFSNDQLNDLQAKCPNTDLSLTVNKFGFHEGILKNTFFDGQFSLKYLAINECQLQTIQDAVFTHANVKNLQTIKLINNQLLMLQASTLAGLINIRYFEFKQLPLQKEFVGKEFLKPLVNTVTKLVIQPSINSTIITDPLQWWQNSTLDSVLYLDLSNTNFQNILAANTFQSFPDLETLILFNCNLQNFVSKTFDVVANTLKYLDLRFNHLKTLDSYFFYMMGSGNVKLNMELNEWFCECDSGLFEFLETYNADLMEEIICYSPREYNELNLMQLDLKCRSGGTTAMTVEVSSSTTWEVISTSTILTPASTIAPPYTDFTSTTPTQVLTTTTSRPINTETITLTCYKDIQNTDAFKTHIVKETLNFTIHTTSNTSVRIEVQFNEPRKALTVLYFTNYNDYQSINVYNSSRAAVHIAITNLLSFKVYLFCVIKHSSTAISPYDCQAHYLVSMEPKAWLLQQDKAWFLTTSILSALIVFLCSVFAVHCLLRHHPYWLLRGNERILQVHNRPNEALVVSRKSTKEALNLNASPVPQRSSNYLKPLQPLRVNALCTAESSLYASTLMVPLTKAPSFPATISRLKSSDMKPDLSRIKLPPTGCHMRRSKLDTLSVSSEPIYQTIDHYEAVNF